MSKAAAEQLIDDRIIEISKLGALAKKLGGKGKAIKGKQQRFTFDDKENAVKFAKAVGVSASGKVLTVKNPTGDDWYEVRVQSAYAASTPGPERLKGRF